jgi:hypothetical protein
MITQLDPKIALKIQQLIRQSEDELVIAIQAALDKKNTYGNLEESQFRNLLDVATTTESPEVIKNFLRYQVGREQKWGRGQNSLAQAIISYIDGEIKTKAETIAKATDPAEKNSIWVKLIRLYLGYGSRYLKYLKDGNKS